MAKAGFREDIRATINRYSRENRSNTPDHILTQYLLASLDAFETSVNAREVWYGRQSEPPPSQPVAADSEVRRILEDFTDRACRSGLNPPKSLSKFTDWVRGLYPELYSELEQETGK